MATTLTTYAVIQGVDRLTGPFRAMAANLRGMNTAFARAGQTAARAGRDMTFGFTLPAALGLSAILREAKEFAKFELGTAIAQVDDKTLSAADGFERIKKTTKEIRAQVMDISKAMGVSPTGLMAGAETITKMGIDPAVSPAYSKFAAQLNMTDPEFSIQQAAEFLGVMNKVWNFPTDAMEHTKRLELTANRIALAANKSRLSVGSLEEGVRQFAPVAAALGVSEADTYAMLAGGVSSFGASEIGTALKSALIRITKPNRDAYGVYQQLGLKRSDYIDFAAASPEKVMQILGYQNSGVFSPKEKQSLLKMLRHAQKAGEFNSPEFTDKFLGALYKAAGATTEEDRDRLTEGYLAAMNQGGGHVQLVKLFADLKKAGITLPQMTTMLEGRHGARYMQMLNQIEEIQSLSKTLDTTSPDILKRITDLRNENLFGQMERTAAAWERLSISLASSPAMETFARVLTQISEALANMDPRTLDLLTKGVLGLAAAGPALWATGSAMRVIGSVAGLLGTNFKTLAAARGAFMLGDMAGSARLAAASFSLLRASLWGAVIAAGAWFAYENWDTLTAGAKAFADELNKGFSNPSMQAEWKLFNENMAGAAASFEKLTGWTLPDSASTAWIDANTKAAQALNITLLMTLHLLNQIAGFFSSVSAPATTSGSKLPLKYGGYSGYRDWGQAPPYSNPLTGGVLDNPSMPRGTSQPFTPEQMNDAKGPTVGKISLEGLKAWLQGVINVRVTGKIDGAQTQTTVTGALSGDAKNVKMNTGVSMPDVKPNGF